MGFVWFCEWFCGSSRPHVALATYFQRLLGGFAGAFVEWLAAGGRGNLFPTAFGWLSGWFCGSGQPQVAVATYFSLPLAGFAGGFVEVASHRCPYPLISNVFGVVLRVVL